MPDHAKRAQRAEEKAAKARTRAAKAETRSALARERAAKRVTPPSEPTRRTRQQADRERPDQQ